MYFIMATKGTISLLDKEGQFMHYRVRRYILIGIPEHSKIFRIFMVGIAWKNLICLVGRMHIKDKDAVFVEGIIHFFKDISHFNLILHVADRVRVTRDKIVFTCLRQIQHIAFYKINLLFG